jgi:hypothetical protein
MSRRRPRRDTEEDPEQLPLPSSPSTPKARTRIPPEVAAREYIKRRAKASVVPGHVKLTFTFDMPRELAERLGASAIREGKNLEAVVIEILGDGTG